MARTRWNRLLLASAVAAGAAGCGSTPVAPVADAAQPGLVIGTLSYHYLDEPPAAAWVVHFERLDTPARAQEYALPVSMDPETQAGVFTGALPAGVYAFRDATNAPARRFAGGRVSMPFEVQAGEVRDVGHYAVGNVP